MNIRRHSRPSPKTQQAAFLAISKIREELKREDRTLHEGLDYIKKHLDKLWEHVTQTNDRLMDLEIQSNLMTRLVTTICLEKLKIHTDALTQMVKKIEKEAIEDSQIMRLEELFSLKHEPDPKKGEKEKREKS
ncbi:MAG: hypothetical protein HY586_07055 [Candidatus Omnitrophica bacterium]|nr:hypothetical protein [Candidatus Omnitrophota bacterium]